MLVIQLYIRKILQIWKLPWLRASAKQIVYTPWKKAKTFFKASLWVCSCFSNPTTYCCIQTYQRALMWTLGNLCKRNCTRDLCKISCFIPLLYKYTAEVYKLEAFEVERSQLNRGLPSVAPGWYWYGDLIIHTVKWDGGFRAL